MFIDFTPGPTEHTNASEASHPLARVPLPLVATYTPA